MDVLCSSRGAGRGSFTIVESMHVLPALLLALAAPPASQPQLQVAALLSKGDAEAALAAVKSTKADELEEHERIALFDLGRRAAAKLHDVEGEARFALLLDAVRRAELPPEQRRYSRSKITSRACAAYEEVAGPGTCAWLARQVTGEYSFHDHSRASPRRVLDKHDIESAHAQYLPLLWECVSEAAHAEQSELFQGAELTIAWAIDQSGRAGSVEISPKRYEAPLGACVRERLAWFRYPPSLDPNRQIVSIPYQVD